MALHYVANAEFGILAHALYGSAYNLGRLAPLTSMLTNAAESVAADLGANLEIERVRSRRRTGETVTTPGTSLGLADEVRWSCRELPWFRWRELGALEAIWAELRDELGNEALIRSENRTQVDEARVILRDILEDPARKRRLPRLDAGDPRGLSQARRVGHAHVRSGGGPVSLDAR